MPLDFRALWANHRKELLIGGGVAAAGLGVVAARRNAAGGSGDDGSGANGAKIAGVSQAADSATGGAGTYDSTPNDVYSAIQPQLEQTQGLISSLMDTIQNMPRSIVVTSPSTAAKPRTKPRKVPRGKGKPAKPAKPRGGTPHHTPPRPKGHPKKATNHPKAHPRPTLGVSTRVGAPAGLRMPTAGGRAGGGVRATAVPKAGGHVAVRLDRPQKVAVPSRAALAPRAPAQAARPAPAKKAAPPPRKKR